MSSSAKQTHPLEPDRSTRQAWLQAFAGLVDDHLDGLETAPAVGILGDEGRRLAQQMSVPIGEEPLEGGAAKIVELIARGAEVSLNAPGPGYLGFIPGGGIYPAALADFVSNALNRYTGLASASPVFARWEADVLAWLARQFGYGPQARGVLTSGGSIANLCAIVTAREHKLGVNPDLRKAVVYCSTQVHHSVTKCLRMAGISSDGIRVVPIDSSFRMVPEALLEQIGKDRNDGRVPFLVVASAGTTNTGAIDPLRDIASLCKKESLWLHVDGAYGGGFVLCEDGRKRLVGIAEADSITFDPHKGLFLPYGTGCLLVREGSVLRRAFSADAEYLQDLEASEEQMPSPNDYGPELSRDYRGLRLWLPLMLHGAGAFRVSLAEKLSLASQFHEGLQRLVQRGLPIEIVAGPQLSIVAFRLRRLQNESLSDWNGRNGRLNADINGQKQVFLSSTMLPVEDGSAYTLRICVLSFRTHSDRIHACLRNIEQACAQMQA